MYNPFAGFDASAHIDYIHYVATHHALPLANMGWEMHQPPLYYVLAAALPSLFFVQMVGMMSWLVMVFIVWKIVRNPLVTVWAATLPVLLYISPMVSNELFAAALITAALGLYVKNIRGLLLGCILGLAVLAKATAWVAVAAIMVDYFWTHKRVLWGPLIMAVVVGGWFYGRNVVLFGSPFVGSVDFPAYHFTQPPGYRDVQFFTDLSPFLKLDLFTAHWYSLWAGTYFSFFYDGHNAVIPIQEFSKAGAALVLLSYPLFALQVFGMLRKLKKPDPTRRFFILYTLLLWGGYIAYNLKLPFYSTVKGAFLASLALPAAYFLSLGVLGLPKAWRRITALLIMVLVAITIKHFWIS